MVQNLEKWKKILQVKCMEALLLEGEEAAAILRAQRLAVWRELAIEAAAKELQEGQADAFRKEAIDKTSAVAVLLTGSSGAALPKRKEMREILILSDPSKVPGIFLSTLQMQFQGAEEYGFGDENTLFTLFNGKRTVFDAAKVLWGLRPFTRKEDPEALEEIARNFALLAGQLLETGAFVRQQLPIVTKDDILKGLRELGIVEGDIVMTHSSLKGFGIVEGGAEAVIAALQSAVTENGILALPGLSVCIDGGTRGAFDPETTAIESWVGTIPETFRKSPGVLRSSHPTHSVLAWGKDAANFLSSSDPMDVFTEDGPWGKLVKHNGKILFLGESTSGNTFLHACEAWYGGYLDYAVAKVKNKDGSISLVPVKNYPGGCRGGWYPLKRNAPYFRMLWEMGIFRETKVGNARVTVASAPELANGVKKIMEKDPAIFFHKCDCADCARFRGKILWEKKV